MGKGEQDMTVKQQLESYNNQLREAAVGYEEVKTRFPDLKTDPSAPLQYQIQSETKSVMEINQSANALLQEDGIKTIQGSPPGSRLAVGTELNLVSRLAREMAPAREVVSLDDCFCVCSTMFRIDPPHILWALEYLVEGRLVNVVAVPEPVASEAKIALDRMLTIT